MDTLFFLLASYVFQYYQFLTSFPVLKSFDDMGKQAGVLSQYIELLRLRYVDESRSGRYPWGYPDCLTKPPPEEAGFSGLLAKR